MKQDISINLDDDDGGGDDPPSKFDIGDVVEPTIGHRPTNSRPIVNDKWYDEQKEEWVYDCGIMGTVREKFLKKYR